MAAALRIGRASIAHWNKMTPSFDEWLTELRGDGLKLVGEAYGGANANAWGFSWPLHLPVNTADWCVFIRAAVEARRTLAAVAAVTPVTFYAWHDEAAGKLCFSTALCTPSTLPFGAVVNLVQELEQVVSAFATSKYRSGIPWSELVEVPKEDWREDEETELEPVDVWAIQLS